MEQFRTSIFEKSDTQPTWLSLWIRNMLVGSFLCLISLLFISESDISWIRIIKILPGLVGFLLIVMTIRIQQLPLFWRNEILRGKLIGEFKINKSGIDVLGSNYKYDDLSSVTFILDKVRGQKFQDSHLRSRGLMNSVVIKTSDFKVHRYNFLLKSKLHSHLLMSWFKFLEEYHSQLELIWMVKEEETMKVDSVLLPFIFTIIWVLVAYLLLNVTNII